AAQGLMFGPKRAERGAPRRSGVDPLVGRGFHLAEIGERALGLLDERGKGRGLVNRQIGENLAVHLDLSPAEAVDKSTIGQAMLAHGGVDALDPEGAEIALLDLAV